MRKVVIYIILTFFTTSIIAEDYYWIGGSGDWSEISHWATTSGGTISHTQTPTASDNVIFDENSFTAPGQIITINGAIAFCQDLDFRGARFTPTFSASPNTTLSIFGSVYLIQDLNFDFRGSLTLSGNLRNNVIDFSIHKLGRFLTFDGGGSWNVISNVFVDVSIEFKRGDVFFMGNVVRTQYLLSNSNSNRRIDLGPTEFRLTGSTDAPTMNSDLNNQYTARFGGSNFVLIGAQSNIIFEANDASLFCDGQGELRINDLTLEVSNGNFILENVRNQTIISIQGAADLKHSSFLGSAMAIDSLILYPAQNYVLGAGLFYNIRYMDAKGSCKESIVLSSSESNNAAIINAQENILVEYVTLSDIHINSGLAEATNSIDLGNNQGWIIDMDNSLDFYWIGGAGNWDDPSHWSLSSGGPSSECIPSSADNVFFDELSFSAPGQSVFINVPNATCNDMSWINMSLMPILTGTSFSTITIHGSLVFNAQMINDFQGDYNFVASDDDNSIISARQKFLKDIYFNNSDGTWTIGDSLIVENNIILQSGHLNTNSQYIEMYSFLSDFDTPRALSLGNSTLQLLQKGGNLITWIINSSNFNLDSGNSEIKLDGAFASFINKGIQKLYYHNITFQGIRGFIRTQSSLGAEPFFDRITFNKDGNIEGSNEMNTLILSNGFSYFLQNNAIQEIDSLLWGNACDGLVTITNFSFSDDPVNIKLNVTEEIENFSLRGINFISDNEIQAFNSIDGGANQNVAFEAPVPRDLFWVGGSGDWDDPSHWAMSSGGPGGQCVPTQLDNVIFDENSFTGANAQITNSNGNSGYCNNFTFNVPTTSISLSLQALYLYGNMDISNSLSINTTLEVLSYNNEQTIKTSGNTITTVIIRGDKGVKLLDDLNVSNFFRIDGSLTFDAQGQTISTQEMNIQSFADARPTLLLDHSTILINGSSRAFSQPLTITGNIDPVISNEGSTIEFTSPTTGVLIAVPIDLGFLFFSSNSGTSTITLSDSPTIQKIEFNGNGIISGTSQMSVDSLIFSSGKSYTFEANKTQRIVKYLSAQGNNCTPIEWLSNSSGDKASIWIESDGIIEMDFVELKDIEAIGSADFNAGSHSTNIAQSNVGWYFPEPSDTDQDGFLGPDQTICDDISLTLAPFSNEDMLNISWSNGSNEATQTIFESTTIAAEVTFANNCSISDSIRIDFDPNFAVNIGNDTTLCETESLALTIDIPLNQLSSVVWQNNLSMDTLLVEEGGRYNVTVAKGACLAHDTILIDYRPLIVPQLKDSLEACKGEFITLSPGVSEVSYIWSNNSTSDSIVVSEPGTYWVNMTDGVCSATDSTTLSFNEIPMIELGNDTLICEDETLILESQFSGNLSYLWSNGNNERSISADTTNQYYLQVTDNNGCQNSDSIYVEIAALPTFDLSQDTSVCFGESIEVGIQTEYDSYQWNTGSNDKTITISEEGLYILTTQEGICTFTDSIRLSLAELPEIALGADTTICQGDQLLLDITIDNSTYLWSDGSTSPNNTISEGILSVIVDRNGCKYSDEIEVQTKPIPTFSLGEDHLICEGDTVILTPSAFSDENILWNTGEDTPSIAATQGRTYIATITSEGCTFSDSVNIETLTPPIFSLGEDTIKCEVNTLQLEIPLGDNIDIIWQDGSIGNSYTVDFEGLYQATAMNEAGCVYEDEIYIGNEECNRFRMYMPNIFTPNNDGVHDEFRVVIPNTVSVSEFEMNIYDRWGGLMYQSNDINESWNGTFNNTPVGTGSYAVAVRLRYTDDYEFQKLENIFGTVIISR